jgi:hypothetical protein
VPKARFWGGPLNEQIHEIEIVDDFVEVSREWLTHRGITAEMQLSLYALNPDPGLEMPTYVYIDKVSKD